MEQLYSIIIYNFFIQIVEEQQIPPDYNQEVIRIFFQPKRLIMEYQDPLVIMEIIG